MVEDNWIGSTPSVPSKPTLLHGWGSPATWTTSKASLRAAFRLGLVKRGMVRRLEDSWKKTLLMLGSPLSTVPSLGPSRFPSLPTAPSGVGMVTSPTFARLRVLHHSMLVLVKPWFSKWSPRLFQGIQEVKTIFIITLRCYLPFFIMPTFVVMEKTTVTLAQSGQWHPTVLVTATFPALCAQWKKTNQRRCTDGKQAYENMLHITCHQGIAK